MGGQKRSALSGRTNEELIALLRRCKAGFVEGVGVTALREEIVERNVGLVKSIAVRFARCGEPVDDLIQAGYIGLLNAVANFDLAHNARFSTYASYLIQGEIRHYIRDKHSTVRIPQWVQTMNRTVKEAEEAFFQREGRPPTLAELASGLDLTTEQLTALLRGREAMTYVSIDQRRRAADPKPAPPSLEYLVTESSEVPFDVRVRILVVIEELTKIQQQVVRGLFYQGKSQTEVGQELGISQRQVSRMKARILRTIRDGLLDSGTDCN
jgi:RNA polymerase sigma-B factor